MTLRITPALLMHEDIDPATLLEWPAQSPLPDVGAQLVDYRPARAIVHVFRADGTAETIANSAVRLAFRYRSRPANGSTMPARWVESEVLPTADDSSSLKLPFAQPVDVPAGVDRVALLPFANPPGGNITAYIEPQGGW